MDFIIQTSWYRIFALSSSSSTIFLTLIPAQLRLYDIVTRCGCVRDVLRRTRWLDLYWWKCKFHQVTSQCWIYGQLKFLRVQVQSQCLGTAQVSSLRHYITSSRWREREREQIFTVSPVPAAPDAPHSSPKQMDSRFINGGFSGRILGMAEACVWETLNGSVYLEEANTRFRFSAKRYKALLQDSDH